MGGATLSGLVLLPVLNQIPDCLEFGPVKACERQQNVEAGHRAMGSLVSWSGTQSRIYPRQNLLFV
jgi:hypothetical protein